MKLLILLIGQNSIFNVSLIKFFSSIKEEILNDFDKFDKVMLVYTFKTEKIAKNIENIFEGIDFIDVNLEDFERNLKKIEESVSAYLNSLKPSIIHLNYTGGTKSMCLGSFFAVESYKADKVIYSDIDFKSKILYLRRGEKFPTKRAINEYIQFSIDEFYKLSNFEKLRKKEKNSEFFSFEFSEFLLKKSINDIKEFYENLWDMDIRDIKKLNWKQSLINVPISFDMDKISNKDLKKLQRFIKSDWLEEYVFAVLNEIKKENYPDIDIAWNVEILRDGDDKFEIDDVLVKGDDFYGISCTTAIKRKDIKQKGFEIIERAQKIGGTTSIPILVCLKDRKEVEELKKDLKTDRKQTEIEIIGKEDMIDKEKLKEKFKKIIKAKF